MYASVLERRQSRSKIFTSQTLLSKDDDLVTSREGIDVERLRKRSQARRAKPNECGVLYRKPQQRGVKRNHAHGLVKNRHENTGGLP
jgi:hypothetical protein